MASRSDGITRLYEVPQVPEPERLPQPPKTKDKVLLDERGREFRSVQFADFVQKLHLRGASRVVFIVGGPYGFANSVYERANEKISLSKMTFSHQMIRLLFVEQLYRAYSILNGLPYHHE